MNAKKSGAARSLRVYLIVGLALVLWRSNGLAESEIPSGDVDNSAKECPVTFYGFERVVDGNLSEVALVASDLSSIQLLYPRSEGLFIMRVESASSNPLYGSYNSDPKIKKSKEYPLSLGLRGVTWDTASQSTENFEAKVPEGDYRVVARYFSPVGQSQEGSGNTLLCEAISPSFHVGEGLILLTFE